MNTSSSWRAAGVAIAVTAVATGLALLLRHSPLHPEMQPALDRAHGASVLELKPTGRPAGSSLTKNHYAKAFALSSESASTLLELYRTSASEARRKLIIDALALQGSPEAVEALIDIILEGSSSDDIRGRALSLRTLSNPEGLLVLLRHPRLAEHPELLKAAIALAARLATPESVNFLVDLYRGEARFPGQQRAVLRTLSQLNHPASARLLASLVGTAKEPGLVEATARALSKIGTPTAVQGILSGLARVGPQPSSMRTSLLMALRRVQSPASAPLRAHLLTQNLPPDVRLALTSKRRRSHSNPS